MSESSDTPSDAATVAGNMSFLTDTSGSTSVASSAGSPAPMGTNGPAAMCIMGKGDRHNRNGPPSTEELEYTRKQLQSAKSTHALGSNIQSATLFALCKELQICVDCDKPGKLPRDQILPEVWDDQQKLILLSFISPALANFGLASHSLSADQWHSIGTIHLVITLIRLWGFDTGRKGKMLVNYIHLVTTIHWANMHTTSKSAAEEYMFHMLEYLCGLVCLYKEAKVQPTHHLALHIGNLLLVFGPMHSWRTWAFEHYNYMLQNIKTNNKFGELELTFMNDACRAANLTAYMFSGRVQAFNNLLPAFLQAFYSDIRGTRLNDILAFGSLSKTCVYTWHPLARGQQAGQDKDHTVLAMRYVQMQNMADIIFCTKVWWVGMCYQANLHSPGDANVIIWSSRDSTHNDGCEPACILALFCDQRQLDRSSNDRHPFAIIEHHVPLKSGHHPYDPYRRFGFAAVGGLYYDKFFPAEVVVVDDIITQFAKTHYSCFSDQLPVEVVHVLPIFKNIHFEDIFDTETSTNYYGEEDGKIQEDVLL
ncbi:hypothetical protein EDD16DRAFT_1527151 [Pisolithus croceorrhizus]|nr:hypothetical protein EDD16DRAFT_1527151 [Pisolithus croceorrhizus]